MMCASVVLAATSSLAAPRVVVVPFSLSDGVPGGAPAKFGDVVESELKSRADTLELVNAPSTRPPPDTTSSGKKGPDPSALKALKAGEQAFDNLDFDTTVVQLKKGIDGILADPASADMAQVLDAYVRLAAAYFRMGEEKKAKITLAELARLSPPDFALPAGFPPIFQREFDKARKRLDRKPKGQVSIEGPSGATAFLDGRDLGMVPVLEEKIAAGTHYVRVEGGNGQVYGQAVDVGAGVAKVRASFGGVDRRAVSALADPQVGARMDGGTVERLAAYCRAAGADYALVGVLVRTDDTQLTLYPALFQARKQVVAKIDPVDIDVQVLSAAPEAYKLVQRVVKQLDDFDTTSVPFLLVTGKQRGGGAVVATRPTKTDDVEIQGPTRRTTILVPGEKDVRALDHKSNFVDLDQKDIEDPDKKGPTVHKGGVPTWVWVVAGVAAAAGAGVGGYFAYSSATRPVTGTVNASW